jgi:hypothetical protein
LTPCHGMTLYMISQKIKYPRKIRVMAHTPRTPTSARLMVNIVPF